MERASNRKWLAAVASIWIQCSCGASYAFGIYSPILKSSQGYDQSTLDMVSVFKDIGANAGILSGFLYSAVAVLHRHHPSSSSSPSFSGITGPWVVHLVGAIQCFLGYFFMWLSVAGIIHKPHVYLMCLFMFLAAHAQTFFNTANVVTAVHNFPGHSGTIVGIMKGYLGLSGAVLIQVYLALFEGNPSTFLLILALLPTFLSVFLMFLVRIEATYTSDDKRHLNSFSAIALILSAYLMILIILENVITLPSWSRLITFSILLLVLSSPISVAKRAQKSDSFGLEDTLSTTTTCLIDDQESKLSQSTSSDDCDEVTTNLIQKRTSSQNMVKFGEEINLWQAMRTVNFWLLFIAMLCGMGSGLATVNNISQIGESLGYTTVERSALVSLWSIWNFLGRFGAGYVSDIFLQRKGWARPLFMTLTLAAMTGGHVVIASGFPGNLYVGSVLVGVCYGSQWSLMPTITSEIFGIKHMGTIFNTIAIASPIGSYILSVRIIGYIYDKNAFQGHVCYGKNCFMLSFSILASVSLGGFFVALVLFFRTRKFYSQVVLQWLRCNARN